MVDIVTRAGKGSPLTNNEVDANFTNLAEVAGVTGEPMGHEDRTTSTISFNASTRTFTIAPVSTSFTVWCKGKKVVVSSAQTVTIPNTTGMYSIYFDANGALAAKAGYFTFSEEAPTAYIYWNAATGACPYFGDERHGVVLDWQTHEYLHRTRGAALASGFAASGYTLGGNGSSNAHAQLTLEGGTFFDEDMKIIVTATNTPTAGTWEQDLLSPARIPVLYLSGTGWVIDAPTDYPLKQGTARPQYNALSGGVWSTADVANNKYATSWILATNNLTYPVIAIIGQAESDLQSAAEAVDFTSLQLPGFPSVEFRPLYRLVFQCADSFSNAVKASLVSITDIRSIAAAGVAASLITDHGNLSGLSDDDHPQYLSVDTVRSTLTAAVKASFLPSQAGNAGKFLTTDATSTSWTALTSGNITTALGFTPYNATNPAGYITGITSSNVTTALGFTPYNATNPSGYVTAAGARGAISVTGAGSYDSATGVINIVGGVTSFNTRTGAITLSSADVTTALGFTPYNSTNPNGYLTGITSTQVTTALGYTPYNSTNPNGYITGITSGMVTTALGFTPYDNSNPSGYITSSALSGYLTSSTAASTYLPLAGGTLTGQITLPSGTPWQVLAPGSGTYNRHVQYITGTEYTLEAALATDSSTASKIPITFTWRGGYSNTGGLQLTGGSSGTLGGNTVIHAANYSSYALPLSGGTVSGQVQLTADLQGHITPTLYVKGDIRAQRGTGNTGVIYFGNSGSTYLYYDGSNYYMPSGQLVVGGNTVLTAGNYTSYSPTLTGGGASGTWGVRITGFANQGSQRLYSIDGSYNYDSANPYFGYLTYNGPANRWRFKVSPATPDAVEVAYADSSGSATSSTSAGYLSGGDGAFYGLLYNSNSGDLNTYNSPGLYSSEYTGGTNNPAGAVGNNGHWIQISDAGGSDVKTQWYYNNAGSDIHMRVMWGNGTWKPWRKLLHDGNYSSYALPLSGGTVTGYTNFNVGITVNSASGAGYGINLYSGNSYQPTYGLFFAQTGNFGTHGGVTSDWATYFTMNDDSSRGWVFRRGTTNAASISGGGTITGTAIKATQGVYHGSLGYYKTRDNNGGSQFVLEYSTSPTLSDANIVFSVNTSGEAYKGNYVNPYLHSGNYSSYALPLSGGTVSGNLYATAEIRLNGSNTARIGWRPAGSGTLNAGFPFALNGATGAINIEVSDNDTGGLMVDNEGVTVYGAGDTGPVFRVIDEDQYQGNGNNITNATQFWVNQDSGTSGFRNQLTIAGSTALHAGNYTSYSPSLTGSGASGTWGINVTGNAGSATTEAKSSATTVPASTAFAKWLFATNTTAGTQDWNHVSNIRPGVGETLLLGSHANGPGGGNYYHPLNFEYSSISGSGNITQLAVAYGSPGNELFMRGSYSGSWNGWNRFLNSSNYSSYALPLGGGTVSGRIYANGNITSYYYDVYPGDGYGVRFWSSDSYKISMASSSTHAYGTVTDYSIKMQMDNGSPGRGFTWGRESYAPIASLNATTGNFQTAGNMYIRGAQISGGAFTVMTGGAGGVGWGTGLNIGDSSNFTGFIQDAGISRWRNWGSGGFDWYNSGGSQIMALSNSGTLTGTNIRATRAAGNFYIDDNYGYGIVGVYSSYRYQGVFAMGDAYKLPADGTTTGSLYGMAWSHPNAGGAAGNLSDHGLLIINNGVFKCAISNSIVASSNITAFSDERLKTNWQPMPEDYVSRLAQIKVGIYDRTDQENITQVGVSAQSLQKLLPQAIMTAKDEMQTLSVNYGGAALASAVELAKEVVDLRARVAHLESLISKLIGD